MKLIVNPHKILKEETPVNEKEINITKVQFEFADEITNDYVKEAYFTLNGVSYKQIIENNECDIPYEVLTQRGQVEIGVVAFLVENEEEIKRYNPSPIYIQTWVGSLKDNAENSEPITPSEMEQFEQQLQDGLNELETAVTQAETLNITSERVEDGVEITTTDKTGTSNTTKVNDGEKGEKGDDYVITPADYNSIANIVKSEIVIPTKTSDLTNDSGFITNTVNNLTNYYLKTQTYTKDEVNSLVGQISGLRLVKVNVLPQTGESGVIYLVPNQEQLENNIFDEYIWIDNDWELIGSTQVDLTGYATETWVSSQISDFVTSSDVSNAISTALTNYYTKTQVDGLLSNKADSSLLDNYVTDVQVNGTSIKSSGVANIPLASNSTFGVIKGSNSYGVYVSPSGVATTTSSSTAEIDAKSNDYKCIVPKNLDYAVKVGVTTNTNTLTASEKTNAQTWLGFVTLTQAQYDALVLAGTVDSGTYYHIIEE